MSRIVVAMGGNALGNSPQEQIEKLRTAARAVVPLITAGNEVVVCHGNGPQVGIIHLAFERGHEAGISPYMPFSECTAMSQGSIGYHLQQALDTELEQQGYPDVPVATILTQVIVSADDPAFKNPVKPVGVMYDEKTARELMRKTGNPYIEDSGRGWRRAVASPLPIGIYETKTLEALVRARQVVVACGGGGIPVVRTKNGYRGVEAVCDKDFAAAKLAELISAHYLFILTAVDRVFLHFGQPDEMGLTRMTPEEAERFIEEGQFAPGSMLPKVQAAVQFARSKKGRKAVIANLNKAKYALTGETGTIVTDEKL